MTVVLAAVIALPASAYAAFQYPEAPAYAPNPTTPAGGATVTAPVTAPDQHGLVTPTYVPPGVSPNGVYTTPITPGSKGTTATYNLDWTIGTTGKSGCMVCHGDKNLIRVVRGVPVSMYVDTAVLASSAHVKLLCTDCHVDFAYKTPHASGQTANDTWRTVAKSSCKNCHQPEFLDWAKSAHSTAGSITATSTLGRPDSSAPGMPRPLCGDCHNGHAIPAKNDAAAQAAVHSSALIMCGKCHTKSSNTYADYYHGAAYRNGAPDAPACWQCHATHLILPTANLQSTTNPDNLLHTCSQCHEAASESYVQAYAPFVHTRQADVQKNPIVSAVNTATAAIQNVFHTVLSAFGKSGSQ